jgi:hypothetical protein
MNESKRALCTRNAAEIVGVCEQVLLGQRSVRTDDSRSREAETGDLEAEFPELIVMDEWMEI